MASVPGLGTLYIAGTQDLCQGRKALIRLEEGYRPSPAERDSVKLGDRC